MYFDSVKKANIFENTVLSRVKQRRPMYFLQACQLNNNWIKIHEITVAFIVLSLLTILDSF